MAGNFYTRAASSRSTTGYLVNPDGLKVQGYTALANGTFAAALSSLKVPTSAHLAASHQRSPSPQPRFDRSSARPPGIRRTRSKRRTSRRSISVYDSLGNAHTVDVYFRKTAANSGTTTRLPRAAS